MAINVQEDIDNLKAECKPLELDYSVVSEQELDGLRRQHVIQYLANLIEMHENIDYAELALKDLEAMPKDQFEATKNWYENAQRDDSKKPQGDKVQEIAAIFSSLLSKRAEINRLRRMCEQHLIHIGRYQKFIETLKAQNGSA